jgi:hypothetical protein
MKWTITRAIVIIVSIYMAYSINRTYDPPTGWVTFLYLLAGNVMIWKQPRLVKSFILTVIALTLASHYSGYKIYGEPALYDNRPVIAFPLHIKAFAGPNILISNDNQRIEIKGIRLEQIAIDYQKEFTFPWLGGDNNELIIQIDPSSPSGIVYQMHANYWCGNTFEPSFFPPRLPSYVKIDLGAMLLRRRLASSIGEQ